MSPCHPDRVRANSATPPQRFRDAYENHVDPAAMLPVSRIPDDHDPFCPPMDPLLDLPKHERRQDAVCTVRAWFRTMRAADFARDVRRGPWDNGSEGGRFSAWKLYSDDWTLFDTQKAIDLETAAHYSPPRFWPDVLFQRSETPMFRAAVPSSTRALTFDDLHRFIDRVTLRGDPASPPGAGHGNQ